MAYVVGVAGIAGAGKSTLVRGLVTALGDAAAIHIDHYQRITARPLREIVAWMERGGDFDEFAIPLLGDHLARLKSGEPVIDPVTLREIPPRKYVVFETHFGRLHRRPAGTSISSSGSTRPVKSPWHEICATCSVRSPRPLA